MKSMEKEEEMQPRADTTATMSKEIDDFGECMLGSIPQYQPRIQVMQLFIIRDIFGVAGDIDELIVGVICYHRRDTR